MVISLSYLLDLFRSCSLFGLLFWMGYRTVADDNIASGYCSNYMWYRLDLARENVMCQYCRYSVTVATV